MHRVTLMAVIAAGSALSALPAHAAGKLNMICSADVVVCEQMTTLFEKQHPDVNVSMVRLSAGEAYARIRTEARNPRTDIWWAGTGDPHMQAANEGLTQPYKSPLLDQQHDWARKQAESADYRTVGVYAGALGWGYNTKLLAEKNSKSRPAGPICWIRPTRARSRWPTRTPPAPPTTPSPRWCRSWGRQGFRLPEKTQRQYFAVHQIGFRTG